LIPKPKTSLETLKQGNFFIPKKVQKEHKEEDDNKHEPKEKDETEWW